METNLRPIRKKRKVTQTELARLTGLSRQYINQIENGKASNVSVNIALKIASALDVDVGDLFNQAFKSDITDTDCA